MFGQKKVAQAGADTAPAPGATDADARPGAKNRPTPTRREAEAARRQPLVPPDRKAAVREARESERQKRHKHRLAYKAGEEWALPLKDRGPQRGYLRDYIDARWSVGEFLMPIVLVGLPLTLIGNPQVMLIGYAVVYGAFLAAVLDVSVLWLRLRRKAQAKFGSRPDKGSLWYVITRTMQLRPSRLPGPRVKRGAFPS